MAFKRDAGLLGKAELTNRLQVQAALHQWEGELRRANAAGTQEAFDLLRGQFRGISEAKLIECLNRLGRDVEIVVRKAPRSHPQGQTQVVFA